MKNGLQETSLEMIDSLNRYWMKLKMHLESLEVSSDEEKYLQTRMLSWVHQHGEQKFQEIMSLLQNAPASQEQVEGIICWVKSSLSLADVYRSSVEMSRDSNIFLIDYYSNFIFNLENKIKEIMNIQ